MHFKNDHLRFLKNIDKDLEDFIIRVLTLADVDARILIDTA